MHTLARLQVCGTAFAASSLLRIPQVLSGRGIVELHEHTLELAELQQPHVLLQLVFLVGIDLQYAPGKARG